MMQTLDNLQIETRSNPDSAIIWLHGLGADGNDFAPIVAELKLPESLAIRFIFPHAPVRPISINQGLEMPGWYDITSNDIVNGEDEAGIRETSDIIAEICQQQENFGITSDRIIIAGFSQGGAIALHCGLRYPRPLAGIMALSTYLPLPSALAQEASDDNRQVDIFMAHGTQDTVVATKFGHQSYQQIKTAGYAAHWHEYVMPHSVCAEEIGDIGLWIKKCLT